MLVVLGGLALGVILVATRSERGQAGIRRWVEARVASSIHGKLHLGRISGNFLTGITIDSLELRDDEDSLFVATGHLRVEYDARDLVDRRLRFRRVDIEHPVVVLRQHENWSWNFKRMFSSGVPNTGGGPKGGFGDFIVMDSTHIRNASFRVTIPWHPDDSLRGARRDSAIRTNIARKDHEIRRTAEGLTQSYRWSNAYVAAPYIRVADPDSVGKLFVIDTMHADETVPPFKWRNVAGVVRLLGDTAWLKAPHFDLPASTGRGEGKVTWGSDLPVRYAVRVWGDSVSLKDVAWVYPTLPTTGGGKMILDIKNERDLHRLDYALSEVDLRTTKSHLTGAITFETGGPVLAVHDVKMRADPLDFDLLRTFNGKPFPADWQGKLTGTVTARGGPLTHFVVDAADLTFDDAHVRGAVSKLRGRGELNILLPAFTEFHRFFASTEHFDLRTLTAIYPAFPKIGGIVKGSVVLDSSWLDVRVSNADITQIDGPAEPSHATGSGRITYGTLMAYDLDLVASPLSLTTLARSYPKMALRGSLSGPIKVRGKAPDLTVNADLTGAAGHITFAGRVDADSLGGYGARGTGTFDGFNVATIAGLPKPSMRLSGSYDVDVVGDSLATLVGPLNLRFGRSELEGLALTGGTSRVRFDNGVVHVDTFVVDGLPGVARARGTLGLTRPTNDSLQLALDVDSLGGLRRYLPGFVAADGTVLPADSLHGTLAVRGTVRGWLDSLALRGEMRGTNLVMRTSRVRSMRGTMEGESVRGHAAGTMSVRADTMLVGGLQFRRADFLTQLVDKGRARFAAGAQTSNGATVRATGGYQVMGDTSAVLLDTLTLTAGAGRWTLGRPTHLVQSPDGLLVDTLVLTDATGARIAGFVSARRSGAARAHLRADAVPLADVGTLAQLPAALGGRANVDLDVTGTREAPVMRMIADVGALTYGTYTAEAVTLRGAYAGERGELEARLMRGGRSVLDASVDYPLALTLFSARTTSDSLRGRLHADSVDLALIQTLAPSVRSATGRLAVDLAISGTPSHPHMGGALTVRDGALEVPDAGLRVASIEGRVTVDALRDSLSIEQLRWTTPVNNGSGSLGGSVVFRDFANPRLDLRLDADAIRAVDRRNIARLDVSTGSSGLTLTGNFSSATMSGALTVDRGTIYIPELINKQLEDLSESDFASLFDTTDVRYRSLMPKAPSKLVAHLRLDGVSVNLGDEVWLRSKEANIKLGGSLNVTRARDDRESARSTLGRDDQTDNERYVLALSGSLSADRGTYGLSLALVQRQFQVQSGRITFFGTPDFNPEIDITALYNVKQSNRADVGVQARIYGNFYPAPTLSLTSSDPTIASSDLVSYLVSGRPASELSSTEDARDRALELFLPTFGAIGSQGLGSQFGSFLDVFQIQSGSLGSKDNKESGVGNALRTTRVSADIQLSDRLFLSVSTGLCALNPSGEGSGADLKFSDALEGKLEYRLPVPAPDKFALRLGREPGASALRCGNTINVRGFVNTPEQIGISLFRSWSF